MPAICRIPKDPGPCSEHDLRFFYDIENEDCKTFIYGGCGGNANHFRSRDECMHVCEVRTGMDAITTTPATTESPGKKLCPIGNSILLSIPSSLGFYMVLV